jgi:hypothetical protein
LNPQYSHSERNHQGLENRLPQPASVTTRFAISRPRLSLDFAMYEQQGFIVVDRYPIRVGPVTVIRMERALQ